MRRQLNPAAWQAHKEARTTTAITTTSTTTNTTSITTTSTTTNTTALTTMFLKASFARRKQQQINEMRRRWAICVGAARLVLLGSFPGHDRVRGSQRARIRGSSRADPSPVLLAEAGDFHVAVKHRASFIRALQTRASPIPWRSGSATLHRRCVRIRFGARATDASRCWFGDRDSPV